MRDKVLVILSSGEAGVARTGAMYAVNALKNGWMEQVRLVLFGPAEELLLRDEPLQAHVREYHALKEQAVACKFIADRDGTAEGIAQLDVRVEYVGKLVSDLVQEGFVPMVW